MHEVCIIQNATYKRYQSGCHYVDLDGKLLVGRQRGREEIKP